jgi:hypothetical protein
LIQKPHNYYQGTELFDKKGILGMEQTRQSEGISDAQRLREANLKVLQRELTGKKIVIKSNRYFERHQREYKVMEVEETSMLTGDRSVLGVKLVNPDFPTEEQPFLKYPTQPIIKTREGGRNKLKLIYSYELSISRDFRHLHKSTRPDLEIYIYY